jgi:Anp1
VAVFIPNFHIISLIDLQVYPPLVPNQIIMDEAQEPLVAVLTSVKDASMHASSYFERLRSLTYTHRRLAIGLLESDSQDSTYDHFQRETEKARAEFHSAQIWKKDFGFRIPQGMPRWHPSIQEERRAVLARSRNHLLYHALGEADWVMWLDVDVIEFPSDIVEQLLAYERDIIHPNCVLEYGGRSFDLNA